MSLGTRIAITGARVDLGRVVAILAAGLVNLDSGVEI